MYYQHHRYYYFEQRQYCSRPWRSNYYLFSKPVYCSLTVAMSKHSVWISMKSDFDLNFTIFVTMEPLTLLRSMSFSELLLSYSFQMNSHWIAVNLWQLLYRLQSFVSEPNSDFWNQVELDLLMTLQIFIIEFQWRQCLIMIARQLTVNYLSV